MSPIATEAVVLSTYLDRADADAIRARADEADRSVAAELRRSVRAYLSAPNDDESPPKGTTPNAN